MVATDREVIEGVLKSVHELFIADFPAVVPGQVDDGWPDEWAVALALGLVFLCVALGVLVGSALS